MSNTASRSFSTVDAGRSFRRLELKLVRLCVVNRASG
jgi:hypothetical protein